MSVTQPPKSKTPGIWIARCRVNALGFEAVLRLLSRSGLPLHRWLSFVTIGLLVFIEDHEWVACKSSSSLDRLVLLKLLFKLSRFAIVIRRFLIALLIFAPGLIGTLRRRWPLLSHQHSIRPILTLADYCVPGCFEVFDRTAFSMGRAICSDSRRTVSWNRPAKRTEAARASAASGSRVNCSSLHFVCLMWACIYKPLPLLY
jgi:hypothetical protein